MRLKVKIDLRDRETNKIMFGYDICRIHQICFFTIYSTKFQLSLCLQRWFARRFPNHLYFNSFFPATNICKPPYMVIVYSINMSLEHISTYHVAVPAMFDRVPATKITTKAGSATMICAALHQGVIMRPRWSVTDWWLATGLPDSSLKQHILLGLFFILHG